MAIRRRQEDKGQEKEKRPKAPKVGRDYETLSMVKPKKNWLNFVFSSFKENSLMISFDLLQTIVITIRVF